MAVNRPVKGPGSVMLKMSFQVTSDTMSSSVCSTLVLHTHGCTHWKERALADASSPPTSDSIKSSHGRQCEGPAVCCVYENRKDKAEARCDNLKHSTGPSPVHEYPHRAFST